MSYNFIEKKGICKGYMFSFHNIFSPSPLSPSSPQLKILLCRPEMGELGILPKKQEGGGIFLKHIPMFYIHIFIQIRKTPI